MLNKAMRYYHTLKFLRWTQIKYRLLYLLKKPQLSVAPLENYSNPKLKFLPSIPSRDSWLGKNTFELLNIQHRFQGGINWNYSAHGKLWTYNLNYFEYLAQPLLSKEEGLKLIHDFITQYPKIKDGMEPFPISLRCISWVKFLIKYQIDDSVINQSLYQQIKLLSQRPEYHLLGNHLLENGFSLLFGAIYFEDENLFAQAKKILLEQLEEQILLDGSHFELSPMYHQIMLFRILDSINLLQQNPNRNTDDLLVFLSGKCALMLGWLTQMSFENGDLPNVNDSIPGIAPSPKDLFKYAARLDIRVKQKPIKECGYRKIKFPSYEMLIDIGNIGPDYIPGHAHSDTFNFILHHNQSPLLVDTGISTYEKNERRNQERSTSSHNTVMLDGVEQSEVWGGFRVARRAKITHLEESSNQTMAVHNGYDHINGQHQRTFFYDEKEIRILDEIQGNKKGTAFFHFHPNHKIHLQEQEISGDFGVINFKYGDEIYLESYQLATGFNQTVNATRARVSFKKQLRTKITFA